MSRGLAPVIRRVVAVALGLVLAVAVLGGCSDDKPNSDEPGSAPQDTGA